MLSIKFKNPNDNNFYYEISICEDNTIWFKNQEGEGCRLTHKQFFIFIDGIFKKEY